MDFRDLSYLKAGSPAQVKAWNELKQLGLFDKLKRYTPVLVGTIPIGIETESSDLDIICNYSNQEEFEDMLSTFNKEPGFRMHRKMFQGKPSTICSFQGNLYPIEIFGQDQEVSRQYAYRHMLIEHKILNKEGDSFRKKIIELKISGQTTEEAFCTLLGLEGDPYESLLKYAQNFS